MNTLDMTLGRLARDLPGATAVFDAHKLDFCCAGNRTLRTAAAEAGIDAGEVAAALDGLAARPPADADAEAARWTGAEPAALIAHILTRYHAVHREQLPELARLSRKVERVHAERPEVPNGLADHLETMGQVLESHMRKEEAVLFPMIERGAGAMAAMPISVMRMEHHEHGEELRRMAALARDLKLPRDACTTWRALYRGLEVFRQDLMTHIHLENNVLFERFAPAAVH